jgi:alpha-methylacyl-CoA racemase
MGPLNGFRVVEMAGIGPAPHCGMLLADMGADVLRIERLTASDLGIPVPMKFDLLNRNKRSVAIDLKAAQGRDAVLRLVESADVLIEGFRPGVMERLGLGPEACHAVNRRLVFGRMTGWGQTGPLSQAAGHDLNYIALTGVLAAVGGARTPAAIPLNLIGDFGGGSMFLAMGVLAATLHARQTGQGQVVDAAITDGSANLMTMIHGYRQMGEWSLEDGANLTDSGAPFYNVYETLDHKHVSIAPVEGKFYRELLDRIGLADADLPRQFDRARWPVLHARLKEVFLTRTREQWCALLEGSDACFAPMLDMDECGSHPHNVARQTYVEVDGVMNPAPAPRFSQTPCELRHAPTAPGSDTELALSAWGLSAKELDDLRAIGAIPNAMRNG